MSKEIRTKISYWFFLIAGMIGVTLQMYMYFSGKLVPTIANGAVTLLFGVFVWKPNVLIIAFKIIMNRFKYDKSDAS